MSMIRCVQFVRTHLLITTESLIVCSRWSSPISVHTRLSLNFGPGKTECMIQYRGKGALDARDSLYHNVLDHGVTQRRGPSGTSSLGHVLEVVSDYKHVGSSLDERSHTPSKGC